MIIKKIATLEDLLVEELRDLFNAEHQLMAGLAKLARTSTNPEVKALMHGHVLITQHHINRLELIFENLGQEVEPEVNKAIRGLVEAGDDLILKTERSCMRDAVIIIIAQWVGHYEIAGFSAARRHAILLGNLRVQSLLTEILIDERETDHRLNRLAERLNHPLGTTSNV